MRVGGRLVQCYDGCLNKVHALIRHHAHLQADDGVDSGTVRAYEPARKHRTVLGSDKRFDATEAMGKR